MTQLGEPCAVEIHPWIEPSPLSSLVADFARVHILISLFDGDPDKWIRFIERNGTHGERQNDLPFAEALKARLRTEPLLIDGLRRILVEFSTTISV